MAEFQTDFQNFYRKLTNAGYRSHPCDPVVMHGWCLVSTPVAQRIPAMLLLGPAGTGKTFFAECFARAVGVGTILKYQCHYGTGKEELLYDLDVRGVVEKLAGSTGSESVYLRPGILPRAVQIANQLAGNGCVVLLLDEIEKTRPEVDAFLLDFIQSGRVYDPHLGEFVLKSNAKLYIMATSNQERLLSEPLMRRFRRVYIKYPPPDVEVEIIRRAVINVVGTKMKPHPAFLKGIVKVAGWLRKQDGIIKPPSTPELINLVSDVLLLPKPEMRAEAVMSWLCAYEEDREILARKYPLSWWTGMLQDKDIFEQTETPAEAKK